MNRERHHRIIFTGKVQFSVGPHICRVVRYGGSKNNNNSNTFKYLVEGYPLPFLIPSQVDSILYIGVTSSTVLMVSYNPVFNKPIYPDISPYSNFGIDLLLSAVEENTKGIEPLLGYKQDRKKLLENLYENKDTKIHFWAYQKLVSQLEIQMIINLRSSMHFKKLMGEKRTWTVVDDIFYWGDDAFD